MLLSSITVYFVLTMKIIVWVDTIFIVEVLTEMILIILTLEKLSTFFFGETCIILVAMYFHGFHHFWLLFAI